MSDRVGADISALEDFRAHLVRFNQDLADGLSSVRSHWNALGSVWTDDMYRSFGTALDEVTPGVDRYLTAAEHHERYLRELIERLTEVTRLRGGW